MITAVKDELSKPSIKDWIGCNTRLRVDKLNCVRDWRNHLPNTGIKLEGGLLRDDTGNHFFMSLQRQGGEPFSWPKSAKWFEPGKNQDC